MRKSLALSAIATLALAGPAIASEFSYNYVEAGLLGNAIDDPDGNNDLKGSGLGVSGSWSIAPGMFGFAGLSGTDYEYRNAPDDHEDFSDAQLQLGVGFHIPLGSKLQLVSGISLQRERLHNDFLDTSLNEEGYGLNAGLRGLIGQRLQWTVGVNYLDYGHGLDDTSWSTGFRYYFTRQFAMGVDIGSTDKNQGNAVLAFRWDVGNR